jgi:predicted ABC-type transport system involved in lysophospholipase L1 biosynthesis ATPase subunit
VIQLNSRGVARLRQRWVSCFKNSFLPHLTALDNVAFVALVMGVPRRKATTKAYHLLRELGLQKKYDANR